MGQPGSGAVVRGTAAGAGRLDSRVVSYAPGPAAPQVPALGIQPGGRIGIIGTFGAGKTTLVKVLSGLCRPERGTVSIDGVDITHLAPEFVREQVGYLPQDVRLYQGTLRDNLTLGLPSPSDSRILQAAAMTGLDRVIQAHPKGRLLNQPYPASQSTVVDTEVSRPQ